MAWPSIAAPTRISAKHHKGQYKSKMETGRVLSGAKHVVGLRSFELYWDAMTQADLDALISAHESDAGGTFSWTHPLTAVTYTVGYAEDEIAYDLSGAKVNRYVVQVSLEQR
ncbi:MAG: hypothetical protein M0036_10265 [Desulfobacteraceae bacterium]|nr:hypothetical protein [Desulfobacteraceae bacterium]